MHQRIAKHCTVAFALAGIIGCGDGSQIDVAGTVAYQGQTVPGGTVLFQPSSGKALIAAIDETGRYQVSAPVGTYQVAVVASAGISDEVDPWQPNVDLPPPLVPEKFGRPETSGMIVTVSPEKSTMNIELR